MKKLLTGEKRNLMIALAKVLFASILLYAALTRLSSVRRLIAELARAAAPVLYGFGLAFVLNIPMSFLERNVFSRLFGKRPRLSRPAALIGTLLLLPGLLILAAILIMPRVIESAAAFAGSAEGYRDAAIEWLRGIPAVGEAASSLAGAAFESVKGYIEKLSEQLPELTVNAAGAAYSVILTLVICVHSLVNKDALLRFLRNSATALLPKRHIEGFLYGCSSANLIFKRYFTAQLLSALIVGLLGYIGMRVLGIPYAELIAVFVFIGALIPIVGPWVSIGASALIILISGRGSAAAFIMLMLAIQLTEDNFIYPRLIGSAIGMKGLEVLASVIVAGGLFGFRGLLAAVPTAAVLRKLILRAVNQRNMQRAQAGETA